MKKKFVLIHLYEDTGHTSILGFSNKKRDLKYVAESHPRFGSIRHSFYMKSNVDNILLNDIKDSSLLNICKNVAEYLAVGEFCMLKKSYFKSAAWFEKAKNSASLGAEIIVNY